MTFEKKGIVLDIPKSLSVGNVAVRCIFTNYDHFSEKCRLFFPRPKVVPDVVVEPQPIVEITTETVLLYLNLFHATIALLCSLIIASSAGITCLISL